jgi:DNA-binding CsgD family transcriptional regulator
MIDPTENLLPEETLDRIHRLWDALPHYGARFIEDAMQHVLRELCLLIDAQQACWIGNVRREAKADPFDGWRPTVAFHLHPDDAIERRFLDYRKSIDAGDADPSILGNFSGAGSFRTRLLSQTVEPGWWKSDFHTRLFDAHHIRDVLTVAMPLGENIEAWICLHRVGFKSQAFQPSDCALAKYVCRPLGWFQRSFALHHGLLLADEMLTPSERRVLGALLDGGTESAIAQTLGLSHATVHTYASRICRKFGVSGRAALAALWFG